MQRLEIRTIADVQRIETEPPERFMPHRNLYEALSASTSKSPEKVALSYVVDADLDRSPLRWTYRQFFDEVQRAANLFLSLSGGRPPKVAILLPAIPEAHFALWGAELVGVACPLNYLLTAEHLVHLVQSAECNILVALGDGHELSLGEKVRALQDGCPALEHILTVDAVAGDSRSFGQARAQASAVAPSTVAERSGNEVVALFHTGGTTGKPKLAQHTGRNQLHSAAGAALMYAMTEDDVIVNGLPMFHVAGSLVFGLSTLLSSGTIVLPTLLGMRNGAYMARYWAFAAREGVTLVTATPTGIATLMNGDHRGCDLSKVRALLTGGAPLPGGLADAFEREFNIPVRNTLGMTECAGVISIEPFLSPRVRGSCGLRLPFVEVRLLDGENRESDAGVLQLRGPNVSPGYLEAARNANTFEDGWLVSGDLARIDPTGRLYVTGRAKDVIIRNSHNIDPSLIEEALAQHPGIAMAAAVGAPDEYAGELPVAYVVARPGADLTEQDILDFLAPRIVERPALPKRVEVLPSLPQTGVGKVYKPALRLLAMEYVVRHKLELAGVKQVTVAGEETSTGLGVCFCGPASSEPEIKALMQRFSIPWRMESRE